MREEAAPHEGQAAVGAVVRKVRMISSAIFTSSTSSVGRSGKMIMGCLWILEKTLQKRKNVQSLSIPQRGSARLRKNQLFGDDAVQSWRGCKGHLPADLLERL